MTSACRAVPRAPGFAPTRSPESPPRHEVLRAVHAAGGTQEPFGPDGVPAGTEWQHFAAEYPHLSGDEAGHARRLAEALAPTFAEVPDAERAAWWREGWLGPLRRVHAEHGFAAAQAWLADRGVSFVPARRLTGDLLGPAAPGDLVAAMLAVPAWRVIAEHVENGRLDPEQLRA
ncbi:hypothetical protein [Kitasatospora sp. NPDC004531]